MSVEKAIAEIRQINEADRIERLPSAGQKLYEILLDCGLNPIGISAEWNDLGPLVRAAFKIATEQFSESDHQGKYLETRNA